MSQTPPPNRIFGQSITAPSLGSGCLTLELLVAPALLGQDRLNELVEHLVEALREELKQYGEMLALLDHQRRLVVPRHGPELLQSFSALREQANLIRIAREEREQRRRHLARNVNLAETTPLEHLVARLPAVYLPLVQALIEENQELFRRVQQRARQNQLLLNQAVQLMEQFMNALRPLSTDDGCAEPLTLHAPGS